MVDTFSDNSTNNEMMNHARTSESSDAASRFLAMQRNMVGSDLLKQLQLGSMGRSEGIRTVETPPSSFGEANNFSSLGLAGLAAAAGLAGLPMSSIGLSPITNSVPTIAALLAASQEKIVADLRQNLNGVEKEHDHPNMQHPKDFFEMNDEPMTKLNEVKDFKSSINNFSGLNDKENNDDMSSDSAKAFLSASPQNNSLLPPSPHENQAMPSSFPSILSKRKYSITYIYIYTYTQNRLTKHNIQEYGSTTICK